MSAQRTGTALGSAPAETTHPRPARKLRRWYALTIVTAVFAAIIYLGASAHLPLFQSQQVSEQSAPTHDSEESRTGKIVLQTDPDQCEQMKFDNTSGKLIERFKPCDNRICFDEQGRPIPMGTIHRLDAISRSFLGR